MFGRLGRREANPKEEASRRRWLHTPVRGQQLQDLEMRVDEWMPKIFPLVDRAGADDPCGGLVGRR